MNNTQKILITILVAQVALVAFVFWPRNTAVADLGPLLGEIDPETITAITILDDENNNLRMTKDKAGWRLPDRGDYPVDPEKIQLFFENITVIETNRMITRTPDSHEQLQVSADKFVRKVSLETEDGKEIVFYLGTSSGTKATHVRLENQDEVYLTGEVTTWEVNAEPRGWINTTFMTVPVSEVTEVVIENPNGVFKFVKASTGEWEMTNIDDASGFNPEILTTLINRLSTIRLEEPLGTTMVAGYQLDPPNAIVELKAAYEDDENKKKIYTLIIGAFDQENDTYVISSSTSEYFVSVNSFSIKDFVNYSLEDFMASEETSTTAISP